MKLPERRIAKGAFARSLTSDFGEGTLPSLDDPGERACFLRLACYYF